MGEKIDHRVYRAADLQPRVGSKARAAHTYRGFKRNLRFGRRPPWVNQFQKDAAHAQAALRST